MYYIEKYYLYNNLLVRYLNYFRIKIISRFKQNTNNLSEKVTIYFLSDHLPV